MKNIYQIIILTGLFVKFSFACPTVQLTSQAGNITSPNYWNDFTKNDSMSWEFSYTHITSEMALVIHLAEMKVLYVHGNHRTFLTADLLLTSQNIGSFKTDSCIVFPWKDCEIKNLDLAKCNLISYNIGFNNSISLEFKPNDPKDFMTPRYFRIEYEYIQCSPTTTTQPPTTQPTDINTERIDATTPATDPTTQTTTVSPKITTTSVRSNLTTNKISNSSGASFNQVTEEASRSLYIAIGLAVIAGLVATVEAIFLFLKRSKAKSDGITSLDMKSKNEQNITTTSTDQSTEANYEDIPDDHASLAAAGHAYFPDNAHKTPIDNAYELDERQIVVNELYTMT